jgi:hypothetical protein
MIDDRSTLPVPVDTGPARVSTVAQLEKSARTRRAYQLDVQHFMRTLSITTPGRAPPGRLQNGDRLRSDQGGPHNKTHRGRLRGRGKGMESIPVRF